MTQSAGDSTSKKAPEAYQTRTGDSSSKQFLEGDGSGSSKQRNAAPDNKKANMPPLASFESGRIPAPKGGANNNKGPAPSANAPDATSGSPPAVKTNSNSIVVPRKAPPEPSPPSGEIAKTNLGGEPSTATGSVKAEANSTVSGTAGDYSPIKPSILKGTTSSGASALSDGDGRSAAVTDADTTDPSPSSPAATNTTATATANPAGQGQDASPAKPKSALVHFQSSGTIPNLAPSRLDSTASNSAGMSMASAMAAKRAAKTIKEKARKLRDERLQKIDALNPAANNLVKERRALRGRKDISLMQRLVVSKRFDFLVTVLITANCILMGFEYQLSADHKEDYATGIAIGDSLFLLFFTVELALRCMAFGARRILFNFQYSLDVAVVLTGWLFDVFFPLATTGTITVAGTDQKGGVQSAVKILRVFRAFRVLRLLTIFEHLWHVVQLFFFSLTPLMWTVLFIMIIIFLFGIFSVVIIGQNDSMTYEADDNNPEHEEAFDNAKSLFGTTRDSIVYLFQMMTLDGWTDMVVPLSNDHIWPYFYFLLFISISALGLMNLVTVTVLETASRQQREVRRNLDIDEKMGEIQDLLQFPGQEVVNTTRTFFIENYKKSLAFRKVFEKLDLTDEDAGYFFDAMDLDSSGELDPFELSTTYMELTTSVMNSTASVALIRSANVPEEKGRILKATMLQAQQSRFQEIAKKNFDDGLKASSRAAVKQNEQMLAAREDRASMSERQDKILNELAALREEVQALNSLREEVSAMRSGGTIKSGGVVVPGGTMGSQHPYNNLHQRPFRSSSRSRVDPDPQFDAVAMMSQTSDGKKAPRAVSSVDLVI